MSSLPAAADVNVGALVLDVATKHLSLPGIPIDTRITDGSIDRTMEAASTLTLSVEDSRRDLLRSGIFSQQIDLELDNQWWRLTAISKSGTQLDLTFEDRVVAYLRAKSGPKKAMRSKMTRAEFILSLVQEVKPPVPFVCPELHVKQKVAITTSRQKVTQTQRSAALGQGIAKGQKLTVKKASATPEQLANGQRVLDVANSLNASDRVMVALIEACITESTMLNLNYGDLDSLGILQVRESTAKPMGIDNRDIEQCVNAFLTRGFFTNYLGGGGAIKIAAKHPEATPGEIAQGCQGSAPAAYSQWEAEASRWVAAYNGEPTNLKAKQGSAAFSQTSTTAAAPFQFQRGGTNGKRENSWHCMQRLASDVQWRCYVVDGRVFYVSETWLLKQKPELVISEDTLGVDGIDFQIDNGKTDSEATVTARASRWAVPPGSVVELYNTGPADGRWLVKEISRGIFDAQATITLKRVTQPLLEPLTDPNAASTKIDPSQPYGTAPALATGKGSKPALAFAAANAMNAQRYPYVWGGGHAKCGTPDHGLYGSADPAGQQKVAGVGYDCSGSTAAILAAADMGFKLGFSVMGSGSIASGWGKPGKGQYITVYANTVHVFLIFHTPQGDKHFGTGFWSKDWDGPGWNAMRSTDGFTAKHWEGT
jgi:hypothetical protein